MKFKKYSFNILDVTIILFILAVVMSFVFTKHNQEIKMLLVPSKDAYLTVNITGNDDLDIKSFPSDTKVYLCKNDRSVGSILSSVNIQEKKYSVVGNGLVFDYSGNSIGVQITLETKVKSDETGCYIHGGEFVSPGSKLELYIKDGKTFTGVVDDILIK